MTKDQLILKLSKYGTVQMLKQDYAFTVLITGTNLSNMDTWLAIQKECVDYIKDRFPLIECMKNDDNFFLLVLKPSPIKYIDLSGHYDLLEYVKDKIWGRLIPAAGTPEEFVHRFLRVCASQVYSEPHENGFTPWKRLLKTWLLTEFGEIGVPDDIKDI